MGRGGPTDSPRQVELGRAGDRLRRREDRTGTARLVSGEAEGSSGEGSRRATEEVRRVWRLPDERLVVGRGTVPGDGPDPESGWPDSRNELRFPNELEAW